MDAFALGRVLRSPRVGHARRFCSPWCSMRPWSLILAANTVPLAVFGLGGTLLIFALATPRASSRCFTSCDASCERAAGALLLVSALR